MSWRHFVILARSGNFAMFAAILQFVTPVTYQSCG
jgi:hypothetical protein